MSDPAPMVVYLPGAWEATEVPVDAGLSYTGTTLDAVVDASELPVMIEDERAMSLGSDPAGGYAVPYQLDGTAPAKKPKKKKAS